MEETSHNDWFDPTRIDEQIAQLIQEDSADAHESRLVRDLRKLYAQEREEEQASKRIHERLTKYLAGELSHSTQEEQRSAHQDRSLQQGKEYPMETREKTLHKRIWTRQFAVLAAILIAALLVGSLLVVLRIVHPNNVGRTITPQPTPTQQKQSLPPELYVNLNTPQSNQILKIDKQTGTVLWRFTVPINSPDLNAAVGPEVPVVADGIAYMVAENNQLYALDAQTGQQRWTHNFPSARKGNFPPPISSPYIVKGILYICVSEAYPNGSVYALDPVSGATEKTYNVTGNIWGSSNDIIYIGSNSVNHTSDMLTAINVPSGKQLWQTTFDPTQTLNRELTIKNNVLYASSNSSEEMVPDAPQDSYAYALDAASGKITWQSPTMNGLIFHVAVDDNGHVYCGVQNNYVYAFDPKTNQRLWQYHVPNGNVYIPPLIQNGIAYIVEAGQNSKYNYLAALDTATGTPQWVQQMSNCVPTADMDPLALDNNVFYLPTTNNLTSTVDIRGFSTTNGDNVITIPPTTLLGNASTSTMMLVVITIA